MFNRIKNWFKRREEEANGIFTVGARMKENHPLRFNGVVSRAEAHQAEQQDHVANGEPAKCTILRFDPKM